MSWITLAVQVAIWVSLYAYNRYTAPRSRKVYSQNELPLPQVEETTPLPLIYGTVRVEGPILAWNGRLQVKGDPGEKQVYLMDMFFVAGLSFAPAVDLIPPRMRALIYGDRKYNFVFGGLGHGDYWQIGAGDPYEGALNGRVSFYDGRPTQTLDVPGFLPLIPDANPLGRSHIANAVKFDTLTSNDPAAEPFTTWPSYRGMLSFALTGFFNPFFDGIPQNPPTELLSRWSLGPSPNIPTFAPEIRALGTEAWQEAGAFGLDANPVEVILDLLTNPFGRLGLSMVEIDLASFQLASSLLANETPALGFSRVFYPRESASQHIAEVVRHIDGSLFREPSTGLWTLELIRQNYDVSEIPTFSDALRNIVEVTDYAQGAWQDTYNRVEVRFPNRDAAYKIDTAVAFDMANAVGQGADGRVRTTTIDFYGCSTMEAARAIAARELQSTAQPLSKITITVDRSGIVLRPGRPFRVIYDHYHVDEVFRVVRVDFGQLFDNRITVHGVLDAFATIDTGFGDDPVSQPPIPPDPLALRVWQEAPRWAALLAQNVGVGGSPDVPRMLAVARPEVGADAYHALSRRVTTQPIFESKVDVAPTEHPTTFTLASDLPREREPYDTSGTGIVVENVSGPLAWAFEGAPQSLLLDPASVAAGLGNFAALHRESDGELEFFAFEAVENLGGGQYKLDFPWRGQTDTPPIDFPAGSRGWIVDHRQVGSRGWTVGYRALGTLVPRGVPVIGSGDDPQDLHAVEGRCGLPVPPADFVLLGRNVTTGVIGAPGAAGRYKSIQLFEEALDSLAIKRDRLYPYLERGTIPDHTITETGVAWDIRARKVDGDNQGALALVDGSATDATIEEFALLLGGQGHGEIDVCVVASRDTGAGGFPPLFPTPNTVLLARRHPTIRVTADRYRNLLGNVRFDYSTGLPRWTITIGAFQKVTGTLSLTRSASASYLTGNGVTPSEVEQTVVVSGYLPRGMRALLRVFDRLLNADPNDTIAYTLEALDGTLAVVGSATTGAVTPSPTTWTRRTLAIAALPSGTTSMRIRANVAAVGDAGPQPDAAFTEVALHVGQFLDNLLANGDLNAGTFTSWTDVVNSFVANTTIPLEGAQAAQGGPFASSEIRQDWTVTAGWDGSTAVLWFWRTTTITGDTGQVVLEARDAGGVLASSSTPVETTTDNIWQRRRLSVDMPIGTTTIRVRLIANRAAGAGNSGALFDALELEAHKPLDASELRDLRFDAFAVQAVPATWQRFRLAFRDVAGRQTVLGGTDFNGEDLEWTDGVIHAPGKLVGMFGGGVTSVDAYSFVRGSGSAAVHVRAQGGPQSRLFAYGSGDSWTAVVLFRVDEVPYSGVACGLIGRADATAGWELGINAAGEVFARVRGTGGTVTATRTGSTVTDGALHMAAISYDGTTGELTAHDERGATAPVSAAAAGEFFRAAPQCVFRLGRASDLVDVVPGMICRVWVGELMTGADVAALWTYGADPTGELTAITHDGPAWLEGPPDASGATAHAAASDQLPIGRAAALEVGDETGLGLALWSSTTNLVPSWDLAGSSWVLDVGATRTTGVIGPSGAAAAVALVVTAAAGIRVTPITLGAGAAVTVTMFARGTTGSIAVELMNASDVVKDTEVVALSGGLWTRVVVRLSGWDASTATGKVRIRADAGTVSLDLSHVVMVEQTALGSAVIPRPLATLAAFAPAHVGTPTKRLNLEGEVIVEGAAADASPGAAAIASISNGVDDKNRRDLYVTSGHAPRFEHWDSTPTGVTSTGTAIDWSQEWTLRGRWCQVGLLDPSPGFAGIRVTGSASSSNYGRAVTWTSDLTQPTSLLIGQGTGTSLRGWVRRVVFRSREEKLA
jgi:hypothetical protein